MTTPEWWRDHRHIWLFLQLFQVCYNQPYPKLPCNKSSPPNDCPYLYLKQQKLTIVTIKAHLQHASNYTTANDGKLYLELFLQHPNKHVTAEWVILYALQQHRLLLHVTSQVMLFSSQTSSGVLFGHRNNSNHSPSYYVVQIKLYNTDGE